MVEDGQKLFKYHSPTVMLSIRSVISESLLHPNRCRYSNSPFVFDEITLIWEGQNGPLRAFAEYFKNGSADFHQTYVKF